MFEVSHSTMRPSRPDLLFRSVFVLRVVEVLITEIHLWWERRRNRVRLRLKSVCCTAHNESSSQYASEIYDIYMQIGSAGDTTLPAGISRKTHLNEISPARWPQYYTRAARYSAQRGSILVLMLLAHLWQICLKKEQRRSCCVFFSLPAAAGRRREQRRRLWQDLMRCQRGHGGKFRLQKQELRTWYSANSTDAAAAALLHKNHTHVAACSSLTC